MAHDFYFFLSIHVLPQVHDVAGPVLANVRVEAAASKWACPFTKVEVLARDFADDIKPSGKHYKKKALQKKTDLSLVLYSLIISAFFSPVVSQSIEGVIK